MFIEIKKAFLSSSLLISLSLISCLQPSINVNRDNASRVIRWNGDVRKSVGTNTERHSRAAASNSIARDDVAISSSWQICLQPHVQVLTELTVEGNETAVATRERNHVVAIIPPVFDDCAAHGDAESNLAEVN